MKVVVNEYVSVVKLFNETFIESHFPRNIWHRLPLAAVKFEIENSDSKSIRIGNNGNINSE